MMRWFVLALLFFSAAAYAQIDFEQENDRKKFGFYLFEVKILRTRELAGIEHTQMR